jgi:HAD superfamily hydrolase (TIGR01509 family)
MIKAILFDMDGVLIDARDWHYEALNRALNLFGYNIDLDAHLSTFDGLPTRRKLEMLAKTRGLPTELGGLINDLKQKFTSEIVNVRCRPVFQHRYALAGLKRDGLKMAVCSNSVRASVRLMMERAALAEYLDLQMSNEDVKTAKPDPEIYTAAMAKLGVRPEEALIVEDNEHGLAAARASGGHVMQVASPDDVSYARVKAAIEAAEAQ